MRAYVPDASVVAAAFFQEEHASRARKLLLGNYKLHAPDLIYAEVGNVIWKRHQRAEIDEDEAGALATDLLRLPLSIAPAADLVESALTLAMGTGRTVYDCIYLALAIKADAVLISVDRRFVNALQGGPFKKHVALLADNR
jgi:predicted nucleic acid-binding protein